MAIAVSAIATAIEVGTVAAALSAVATTGAVLTGVGVLTKSKELTKIGGTMALVGGVGSLVNGAVTGITTGAAADGAAATGSDAAAASTGDLVTGASDALQGTAAGSGSSGIIGAVQNSGAGQGFDLKSANFGVDNSLMSGVAPTVSTAGAADFSGAVKAATPSLSVPGQTIDDYAAGIGVGTIDTPAGEVGAQAPAGAAASGSGIDAMKAKFGAAWDSFSPTTKAELLKSALAIPGAIQGQKNTERALDIQQQKVNQTSYGSQVPAFGIIQRAQKGGA